MQQGDRDPWGETFSFERKQIASPKTEPSAVVSRCRNTSLCALPALLGKSPTGAHNALALSLLFYYSICIVMLLSVCFPFSATGARSVPTLKSLFTSWI